jgi:hypothetical protein
MSFLSATTGYFPNAITGAVGGVDGLLLPFDTLQSISGTTSNASDVREVLYSVLEGVADKYLLPETSGSTQMSVTRASTVPNDSTIRKSYTVSFNLDFPTTTVKNET